MCGRRFPGLSGRLLVVIIFFTSAGCIQSPDQDDASDVPADPADPELVAFYDALATDPAVTFEADHGDIHLIVYASLMPTTAEHFLGLVEAGFHDGTIVHRVVDDFVIQGGDPSGTGQLGSGEAIPFEAHPDLYFGHGAMGLARDLDPDSGDSQWFITEKPQPHLHAPSGPTGTVFGAYAMYGQVYAGMDVVRSIAAVDTIPGADRPIEDVVLESATIAPPPPIDLLDLPFVVATAAGASHTIDVVHPLHTFTHRPFPLTVFLEPADEGTPLPEALAASLLQGGLRVDVVLEPLEGDPAVYRTDVELPRPGTWTLQTEAGGDEATATVETHAWHPDYAAYDRTPTPATD